MQRMVCGRKPLGGLSGLTEAPSLPRKRKKERGGCSSTPRAMRRLT
jgi:hypothetical protein